MRKVFLFAAAFYFMGTGVYAQQAGSYGSGMPFVANGFRTVSEENAVMEEVRAERRKRYAKEIATEEGTQVKTKQVVRPVVRKQVVASVKTKK